MSEREDLNNKNDQRTKLNESTQQHDSSRNFSNTDGKLNPKMDTKLYIPSAPRDPRK